MIEIGRLCLKIAGREAGRKCIIIDIIDKNYVMIDGQVRRKKCNIAHLEPLDKKIELKKNASHSEVVSEFKKLNIEIKETKKKEKKEKPKKIRGKKKISVDEKSKGKGEKKKAAKKEKVKKKIDAKKKEDIESKLEK